MPCKGNSEQRCCAWAALSSVCLRICFLFDLVIRLSPFESSSPFQSLVVKQRRTNACVLMQTCPSKQTTISPLSLTTGQQASQGSAQFCFCLQTNTMLSFAKRSEEMNFSTTIVDPSLLFFLRYSSKLQSFVSIDLWATNRGDAHQVPRVQKRRSFKSHRPNRAQQSQLFFFLNLSLGPTSAPSPLLPADIS